jgi:putative hydrolase of the HAD superfamily
MIETAIEVTDARVPAKVIHELIEAGQMMLAFPIELLPHAREAVTALADDYRVVLVTKGDLLAQERKLAQSGLGDLFDAVEIVSEKTPEIYRDIFANHTGGVAATMMVENSIRSDVTPMIAAGGWGTHVPHSLTWDYEQEAPPCGQSAFSPDQDLSELTGLLAKLG